jgi:hypothetical protein
MQAVDYDHQRAANKPDIVSVSDNFEADLYPSNEVRGVLSRSG